MPKKSPCGLDLISVGTSQVIVTTWLKIKRGDLSVKVSDKSDGLILMYEILCGFSDRPA